jgi:hypothetical protein
MAARKTVPTWLYHKEQGGKIHQLVPDAPLPMGWRDMPWPGESEGQPAQNPKTNERKPRAVAKPGRASRRLGKREPRKAQTA